MKKLNLRLTDEQHSELEGWAQRSNRSLQREVVYRLFHSGRTQSELPDSMFQPLASADAEKGRTIVPELSERGNTNAEVVPPGSQVRAARDVAGSTPAASAPRSESSVIRAPEDVPAAIAGIHHRDELPFKPDFKAPATKKGRK